ncbi:hypothetical protein BH10PSE14_BH10PSE14_43230 [soil metagenome]
MNTHPISLDRVHGLPLCNRICVPITMVGVRIVRYSPCKMAVHTGCCAGKIKYRGITRIGTSPFRTRWRYKNKTPYCLGNAGRLTSFFRRFLIISIVGVDGSAGGRISFHINGSSSPVKCVCCTLYGVTFLPARIPPIDRIVCDIGVEIHLVLVPDRISLQEPPELGRVDAGLVIIHAEVRQPSLSGILEPPDIAAARHTIFVVAVNRPAILALTQF